MSRQPRFEVVRSDAGWFARFRAANGRIVLTSEVYRRRAAVVRAVTLMAETFGGFVNDDAAWTFVDDGGQIGQTRVFRAEVRDVDEREVSA